MMNPNSNYKFLQYYDIQTFSLIIKSTSFRLIINFTPLRPFFTCIWTIFIYVHACLNNTRCDDIWKFNFFRFSSTADGTSILVRQCGDYDWGSHCGDILYDSGDGRGEELIDGCLESCDHDGCNLANRSQWSGTLFTISLIYACFFHSDYNF